MLIYLCSLGSSRLSCTIMCFKRALSFVVLFIAILSGIVWYQAWLPLSPKIEDTASKVLPFLMNVVTLISHYGCKFGLGTKLRNARTLIILGDTVNLQPPTHGISTEDSVIAGLPVTIYRPDAVSRTPPPPAIIYFHGGGMIQLNRKLKFYKAVCVTLANQTKSVVISVDYRLAPEHTFPAQFNDAFAVVSAVTNEPANYGIDGNRIALAGDSAGGLLVAATSLELAKQTSPRKIAAQVLHYPWLQSIDMFCLHSYKKYGKGFLWSDEWMAISASSLTLGNSDMASEYLVGNVSQYFMKTKYWEYIANKSSCKVPTEKSTIDLPTSFVKQVANPRFSPLLADDVRGSPPTFVAISDYDFLASEGVLFAERLKQAGVTNVVEKHYKTYHAFIFNLHVPFGNDTLAKEAMNDTCHFLNSVFHNTSHA